VKDGCSGQVETAISLVDSDQETIAEYCW
jgi:hypothetical protein